MSHEAISANSLVEKSKKSNARSNHYRRKYVGYIDTLYNTLQNIQILLTNPLLKNK